MNIVRTLIGNIKGPAGATGATGATGAAGANGADGAAATVNVGTVSTTAYGNPAQVINSGTESAAVLDFVIPQGRPGEEVTDMAGLTLGTMTTQTGQFPTPQIGDNGATLWGKVVKYFSDLRTLIGTKLNTANVVNNFTTTESGYALDARAGKTLNDSLAASRVDQTYNLTGTNNISVHFFKWGKVVYITGDGPITNPTALTGTDNIGSVPDGYAPRSACYAMVAGARSTGNWASATYYHATIIVNSDGTFNIRGNANEMKQCAYIAFSACWTTA